MSAKHEHGTTKEQQHRAAAASLKTKKGQQSVVLAPTPMLFQRIILKDGTRGVVTRYRGTASAQVFVMQDTWGHLVEFTRDQVASYK